MKNPKRYRQSAESTLAVPRLKPLAVAMRLAAVSAALAQPAQASAVVLGLGDVLYQHSGQIVDLALSGGTLHNNGLVGVTNLSGAFGRFAGSGTTTVQDVTAPSLGHGLTIGTGHTLEFQYGASFGVSFGTTGLWLEPNARFVNFDILDGARFMLQGTANFATLPRLVNHVSLIGGFHASGVRVDTAPTGTVFVGVGDSMYLGPAGSHSGRFTAAVNSLLTFGGPWGHEFLPGSSLHSDGKVVFAGGVHKVGGSYDAQETEVRASVTFKGPLAHMPKLRVDSGGSGFGELRFETPAAVSVGELTLDSGYVLFDVAPGSAPSTVQTLILNGGGFGGGFWGGASTPVNVVNPLIWNAGNISGSGGVTALGGIEINATSALNRGLYGRLRNPGTANWHGGVINWGPGGMFENLAGATFNLNGDFSAGSGGFGRFVNAGTFIKTAGSGTATLGMAFDNSGLARVDAGTLRLSGGGSHDGGHFEAWPGALIELAGNTSMKRAVTTAGRVDIRGGSLTLLSGASFTNAAGNGVNVSDFDIGTLAGFVNHGNLNVSGTLDNQGFFTHMNHLPAASVGAVINAGTLNNSGSLSVVGNLANSGTLNNMGDLTIGGGLNNSSSFRNDGSASRTVVAGAFSSLAGNVINEGHLEFQGGNVLFSGTGSNLGQIQNGVGTFTIASGASLDNQGSVLNDGGTVFVDTGGTLGGSGSYVQTYGLTEVKGVLQADAGIDIQAGLLRGGTPPGYTGPTRGTVIGNVNLGQFAQWKPGNSPGTFTVLGDVSILGDAGLSPGDGNIEIEFDSLTVHDRIVVSGAVTLSAASIDLVFAPGFSALDGDSLEWLRAGQVVLPNGPGSVVYNLSGLSNDWAATPSFGAHGVSLEMVNLLASAIPTSGSPTVAAGDQAYNAGWAQLDGLNVAGNLSNRAGGTLLMSGVLNVDAGGRLLNRSALEVYADINNAGELINRHDGHLSRRGMLNSGSLINEGRMSDDGGTFVNTGRVINRGLFEAWNFTNATGGIMKNAGVVHTDRFTNAAGGVMENLGAFSHTGQFVNEAGGRVENRGSMTAGRVEDRASYYGQLGPMPGHIQNQGEFIVSGNLQNNAATAGPAWRTGSIVNQDGGTFTVEGGGTVEGPGTYFQIGDDSVTRVNGSLAASDITIMQGTLVGSGTLIGPVTLGGQYFGATVRPGNSPGTLTIDGNLDAYHTIFDIELAGPALYDRVAVTGDAKFTGGVVNFLLRTQDGISYDYRPAAGDSFDWLTVAGAVNGLEGLNWNLNVVGDGWSSTLASSYWGSTEWNGLPISFQGGRFTVVPVPGAWGLMLSGLGLLGYSARRRVRTD